MSARWPLSAERDTDSGQRRRDRRRDVGRRIPDIRSKVLVTDGMPGVALETGARRSGPDGADPARRPRAWPRHPPRHRSLRPSPGWRRRKARKQSARPRCCSAGAVRIDEAAALAPESWLHAGA